MRSYKPLYSIFLSPVNIHFFIKLPLCDILNNFLLQCAKQNLCQCFDNRQVILFMIALKGFEAFYPICSKLFIMFRCGVLKLRPK